MVAKEEAEEADVEAKAKRPRTDGVGVPPLFSQGGYSEGSDGWWAHSGGEWLHNKTEMAYFHLPTGQIRVVLDESAELPAPANGKEQVEDEGPLLRGRVRWFNEKKGFGFIEPIDDAAKVLDKDLFVHRNQIFSGAKNGEAEGEAEVFASLQAEEVVTFHLGQTDDGRMCAVRVKVAEADADEAEPQDGNAEDGDGEDASEASSVEIDLEEELKCGFHQDKAEGKETCEDYLVEKLKLPINVLGETATFVFFGVFDGHGGPYCAEHVSTHLAKNILARLRDRARNVSDEVAVKTALLGGFKQTEHNYLQHAKKTDDSSGSTACTMTVFGPDEQMRLRLFMANCGDSRAVLCTSGTAQRLTEDHKPNLPAEKKRIEAADGGVVEVQGVWRCVLPQKKRLTSKIAGLAVSRSFGDKDFKGPDIVSAEPEITVHEVDWDADEFVILATDGIWDVLSDKDSVALVRQHLQSGKTEAKAAEALVKRAREKGSQDDCTALVVRFSWSNKGQQTDAAEPEEQGQEADAGTEEMEVGEEEEEEMMDDDEEAEAEALARMARAMAANAGAVLGPGEELEEAEEAEDAISSQAAPQKQAEDRDIFADGETEEQDEEAAGLKRWDKTNAAGALISPLFEGLGPTREELAAGDGQDGQDGQDGRGTVIGGLLKDVGGDKAEDNEKPPEAKEAVDADMDMFG